MAEGLPSCSGKDIMPTLRHLLRPVAVLATGAVIATTLTAPAQAAADDRSARWLQRQLTDGLVVGQYKDTFTDPDNPVWVKYNDYGLSADVALGLAAIGGRAARVAAISDAVAPHVDSWTTGADFGAPDDVYAGSVAKAVVLAQKAGDDPAAYGGVDLVDRLESTVSGAAPTVGRIEDQGSADFANTIGQGFAALGLANAGSPDAAPVLAYLLQQQCDEGYFRLNFSAKDAADQSCDSGTAESAADTDATALTLIALLSLPAKGQPVRAAIDNASDWLIGTQKDNGSFGGGPTTRKSNANSTGLAAWALGERGACRAAKNAATWVRGLQVRGNVRGTPLAGEKGGIAYNRAAFKEGKQKGIKRATRDQWRRTSAQAARGLSFITGC